MGRFTPENAFRVLSAHGTALYVDETGELRHGPPAQCPANVYLMGGSDSPRAFVYQTGGLQRPVVCIDPNNGQAPRLGTHDDWRLRWVSSRSVPGRDCSD